MAPLILFLAMAIQGSLTFANEDEPIEMTRELLEPPKMDENEVKELNGASTDWMNLMLTPGVGSPSSVELMSQITNCNKTEEERLEEMKRIAKQISESMLCEMTNVLSYVVDQPDKEVNENGQRKKRSVETPMDSSQLVMRLLRHIKANNEYQNIAIEKMMTAQEIADKYGIEFNPDPEILSELALSANEHAKEVADLLKETIDVRNVTEKVEFVPIDDEQVCPARPDNDTYYSYVADVLQEESPFAPYEYAPEQIHYQPNHHHPGHHYNHHQVPQGHQYPPVSVKPNYYDSMMAFSPIPDFYHPYSPFEPVTTTTTIIFPVEEIVEPEPELVGEEYEETISSKVFVDHDGSQPGEATVNHVTTYTISEKAHFKTPEIQQLPQQMQYSFFLL